MIKLLVILVVSGLSLCVAAQEVPPQIQGFEDRDELKELHIGTPSVPIEQSFLGYARSVAVLEVARPGAGLHQLTYETDITAEEGIVLMDLLRKSVANMESRSATEPREAACDGQIPRAYGDDAYDTIELMESAEDNIPLSEYQSVVDQIGPTTAAKFNAILEENKENVVYWRLDHRKIDARKGETADEFLASFCAN